MLTDLKYAYLKELPQRYLLMIHQNYPLVTMTERSKLKIVK